jgi:secreted trypsin-like serine protease
MRSSFCAVLTLAGCQGIPVGAEQAPIIGGQTETGDPAVVLLVAQSNGGESFCTAEIVSPHVILTAAHCVDPATVGSGNSFQVFLGSDINGPQGSQANLYLDVSETHYDTTFDPNRLDSGHDVGVAILSTASTVTPIPMNRTALTQSMVGQPLRLVGYGISSGSDPSGQTAGTKRQVSTPLSDFDSLFIDFGTASKGTCEGDSGGPAFMTINGTEVIVGVTSFGPQGCDGGSTDTRVDTRAVPFIDPYIQMFDPGFSTTGSGGTTTGGTTTGGTTTGGTTTGGTTTGSSTTGSSTTGSSTNGSSTSGGNTSGGNTGTCSATKACPANYTCVMSGGVGECILTPTPQSSSAPDSSGCSVGGHAAPTPFFFIVFGFVFLRRSKRQET